MVCTASIGTSGLPEEETRASGCQVQKRSPCPTLHDPRTSDTTTAPRRGVRISSWTYECQPTEHLICTQAEHPFTDTNSGTCGTCGPRRLKRGARRAEWVYTTRINSNPDSTIFQIRGVDCHKANMYAPSVLVCGKKAPMGKTKQSTRLCPPTARGAAATPYSNRAATTAEASETARAAHGLAGPPSGQCRRLCGRDFPPAPTANPVRSSPR